jgi:hypothetical protein
MFRSLSSISHDAAGDQILACPESLVDELLATAATAAAADISELKAEAGDEVADDDVSSLRTHRSKGESEESQEVVAEKNVGSVYLI